MSATPTKRAYTKWENINSADDFLQLSGPSGSVSGWIDSSGTPQGTLATGGGIPSFSSLIGGINTSAAMVIGSGASLVASGTGIITATNGIISVTSLPLTCTVGQGFILPDGSTFVCGPVANKFVSTSYSSRVTIDPRVFGAKGDVKFASTNMATIVLNSGSPNLTISTANFCNGGSIPCATGQQTDIGKIVNVTNGIDGSVSGVVNGIPLLPNNTTILSVTSSTQVVLSANATGTIVAGSAAWFTDDTVALTAASAALAALPTCGTVHLAGFFSTSAAQFNTPNTACAKLPGGGDVAGGSWMSGESNGNSGIYIMNEFNAATCIGNNGTYTNVCFLAGIAGGRDFSMYGLFNGTPTSTNAIHIVAPFSFASVVPQAFTNVAFLDFMGGNLAGASNTNIGFSFQAGVLTGVEVQGFGGVGCQLGGQGGPLYTVMNGGGCGNTLNSNLLVNGPLSTRGITLGQTGSGSAVVRLNAVAAVWYSSADSIYGNPNGNPNILVDINQGLAFIDGLIADNSSAGGGAYAVSAGSSGTVHLARSTLKGTPTGGSINIANGGQLFDECGNIYNSIASAAAGNKISGPCVLQGQCTGVATSSATLGLYGLGQFAALTCTSTVVNLGQNMQQAGTLMGISVTATAGGVAAGSGVMTVLKNGIATTITCTIGTGTSCIDMAHNVAYVQGDVISVQFTTQGGETLAGIKAVVLRS